MTIPLSYEPLLPHRFLHRAVAAHGERIAVIDGAMRYSYQDLARRSSGLAGVLSGSSAPVAILSPNTHEMLESHFGVPMAGRPLVTINTRLSPPEVAYILEHSEAATLIAHETLRDTAEGALALLRSRPDVIWAGGSTSDYEDRVARGPETVPPDAEDERGLLSINYTSGTTGKPKGVMYHHRGAYLQAVAMVGHLGLNAATTYLWTLPMFHCNGWTFPWAVTAAGGTHLCLPRFDPEDAWRLIGQEGVTHLCGAPTVLSMLAHASAADEVAASRKSLAPIRVGTGGAPPSPTLLARMSEIGIEVTHFYGLTETYGPALVCDWRPEWNDLPAAEQALLRARQGVPNIIGERARVITPTGDAPPDGHTLGEIAIRGNNVMLGYFKAPDATNAAAPDGWFRTGDLGVMHPNGYIELRDRSKDVIISGGENISSVEVEQVVAAHPAVLEVAVIGVPDDKWGEVPAAFVTLRPGAHADPAEIISHVRGQLAAYKAPKHVYFEELPHTSTGKVQKFVLRERAWANRTERVTS